MSILAKKILKNRNWTFPVGCYFTEKLQFVWNILSRIVDESNNEKSTNKGHIAFIEFQDFHDTLFYKTILRQQMRGIKSKNHNLGTYKINKISLSCFDDKWYILKNGINTLACGHKDI